LTVNPSASCETKSAADKAVPALPIVCKHKVVLVKTSGFVLSSTASTAQRDATSLAVDEVAAPTI